MGPGPHLGQVHELALAHRLCLQGSQLRDKLTAPLLLLPRGLCAALQQLPALLYHLLDLRGKGVLRGRRVPCPTLALPPGHWALGNRSSSLRAGDQPGERAGGASRGEQSWVRPRGSWPPPALPICCRPLRSFVCATFTFFCTSATRRTSSFMDLSSWRRLSAHCCISSAVCSHNRPTVVRAAGSPLEQAHCPGLPPAPGAA